jgi:hypothetical protein
MATSNGEIIKSRIALLIGILIAQLCSALSTPTANAAKTQCKSFNFTELFYADYSTGSHWNNTGQKPQITWSAHSPIINDEPTNKSFTGQELTWIRTAFNSWDIALNSVEFIEVSPTSSPQITIGYVDLIPSKVQPSAFGFWTAWVTESKRNRASIKLKSTKAEWFSNSKQFIHTVQHELGNVLGLGDITPTSKFASVLEDPWQPPYGNSKLGATDIAMIRQLYGEPNYCTVTGKGYLSRSRGKVASLV